VPHTNVTTKPYRPSNGTEGEMFTGMFCDFCLRDIGIDDERTDKDLGGYAFLRTLYPHGCPILAATLGNRTDSPDYPTEWVYDDLPDLTQALSTARCTAFLPDGQALAARALDLIKKHSDQYLIWSHEHQAWWKPARHGYTSDLRSAGIYSKKDAREILLDANPRIIEVPGMDTRKQPHNEAAIPLTAVIPSLTTAKEHTLIAPRKETP